MSRLLGSMFQLGYVVRDLEAALVHWTEKVGVGPFFLIPMPLTFEWLRIDGETTTDTRLIARNAIAYSGDIQIELLLPGPVQSTYHEFLAAGASGAHHIGLETDRLEEQVSRARSDGARALLEGELPGITFAYLDMCTSFPGPVCELVQMGQQAKEMFNMIKSASRHWDGNDPIREIV